MDYIRSLGPLALKRNDVRSLADRNRRLRRSAGRVSG